MNASSLYVSTCRLIIQSDLQDQSSWCDLYRLVPYLRQSLSCTVCENLLIDPQTPSENICQHHVCKHCKWGRKKLKPACNWCFDYNIYIENIQLRILLQCYKKLCEYLMSTQIYKHLAAQVDASPPQTVCTSTFSLIEFIQEGAGFIDDFKTTSGLTKSAYSILPCVYTSSSTQTNSNTSSNSKSDLSVTHNDTTTQSSNNDNLLYSVMYAGNGNKITIKRKTTEPKTGEQSTENVSNKKESVNSGFKKPNSRSRVNNKRKGCRCGNATPTPGKLTCCGQRCPCYVESKPCLECKCRGCRNPHRPNGFKVRPHIPQLHNIQGFQQIDLELPVKDLKLPTKQEKINNAASGIRLHTQKFSVEDSIFTAMDPSSNIQVVGVYTTHLQDIGSNLPTTLLMEEDSPNSIFEDDITSQESSNETSDIEVV